MTPPPPVRCPECHVGHLVVRSNKRSGAPFLACDRYPECKHTEPMHEIHRLRAMGHPELPLVFDEGTP